MTLFKKKSEETTRGNSDALLSVIERFDAISRSRKFEQGVRPLLKREGNHIFSNGLFETLEDDFKSAYSEEERVEIKQPEVK